MNLILSTRDFLIDYLDRHKHPLNAFLHIIGVPMVFYSLYEFFAGDKIRALFLFSIGYFLQYLGHKAQGNEVGEVILIKKICHKLLSKSKSTNQSISIDGENN